MTWMLLLACLQPASTTVSEGVAFPHPTPYPHGADALEFGEACLGCHRDEGGAPACDSCHDYPHAEGWLVGARHGAATDDCGTCHGTEPNSPACTSCHGSYPHDATWTDEGHGTWSVAHGSPTASCGSCHGTELEGRGEASSCDSCHDYPHPADMVSAHRAGGSEGCDSCHSAGSDSTGGACASCHPGYPHADDWTRGHIDAGKLQGEGACLTCHEPGDGPSAMPATCGVRCHGGAP